MLEQEISILTLLIFVNIVLTMVLWIGTLQGFNFVKKFLGEFGDITQMQKMVAGSMSKGGRQEADEMIAWVENKIIPVLVPDQLETVKKWLFIMPRKFKAKWYPELANRFMTNPEGAMSFLGQIKGVIGGLDQAQASSSQDKNPYGNTASEIIKGKSNKPLPLKKK